MTDSYLTYAAFFTLCALLLILPFVPAFREWLRPTDLDPLPVAANYTNDIDHFARRLHADVSARLGTGTPTGYEEFDFVSVPPTAKAWSQAAKRLISRASIVDAGPIHCPQPLYVDGSIHAGAGSSFPALYAAGDIELGENSTIHDWAHADGVLRLGDGSVALRRLSAGRAIELGDEAWFERLQAPLLRFGTHTGKLRPPAGAQQKVASLADLPGASQQTPALFLVRGDCALPPGCLYEGSLVVTGFLTIGAGTTIVGDIKAREGLSIGHRASVKGAVTCEKRVYVFKDARVWGPLVSESDILVGSNAVIGLPDAQTTVSALNVIVEDGVVIHGTLWAREIGMVKKT